MRQPFLRMWKRISIYHHGCRYKFGGNDHRTEIESSRPLGVGTMAGEANSP